MIYIISVALVVVKSSAEKTSWDNIWKKILCNTLSDHHLGRADDSPSSLERNRMAI